jgi:hypothetical protein
MLADFDGSLFGAFDRGEGAEACGGGVGGDWSKSLRIVISSKI